MSLGKLSVIFPISLPFTDTVYEPSDFVRSQSSGRGIVIGVSEPSCENETLRHEVMGTFLHSIDL